MIKALATHRESLIHLCLMSDHLVEGTVLDQLLNLIPLLGLERQEIFLYSIPRQYKGINLEEYVVPGVKFCNILMRIQGEGGEEVTLQNSVRAGIGVRK